MAKEARDESHHVIVVIDSTAIGGDDPEHSIWLRTVALDAPKAGVSVVVPEIIVLEKVNGYRLELERRYKAAVKTIDDYNQKAPVVRLSPPAPEAVEESVQSFSRRYRAGLTRLGVKIPKMTAVESTDLAKRVLGSLKPFREKGVGVPDYLLWLEVLRILEKGALVHLVTGNNNDFLEQGGQLHIDLQADIRGRGIAQERLVVWKDLEAFYEREIAARMVSVTKRDRAAAAKGDILKVALDAIRSNLTQMIPSDIANLVADHLDEDGEENIDEWREGEVTSLQLAEFSPTLDLIKTLQGEYVARGQARINGTLETTIYWHEQQDRPDDPVEEGEITGSCDFQVQVPIQALIRPPSALAGFQHGKGRLVHVDSPDYD